jgi:hypothetical protein
MVVVLMIVIMTMAIPKTHALILSKLTTHFLHVTTIFASPQISWNDYHIEADLNESAHLTLDANYTKISDMTVALLFRGNVDLFSQVADTPLPHVDTNLSATLDKNYRLNAQADLLDGNLTADFDLNTLDYEAYAQHLSLLSYQNQQAIPPYIDGYVSLESQGALADILDINVAIKANKMLLLTPAIELLPLDTNTSSALIDLNTTLSLKNTILQGEVLLDSNLADVHAESLYYDLEKGDFDIVLHVSNDMKQYEPLKSLHVTTHGRYKQEILSADALIDLDKYFFKLSDINYKEEALHAQYELYSNNQEFVDITSKNALYGALFYSEKLSEATITSALLHDTLNLTFQDQRLHVKSNALSLEGLLEHLKQEKMATAHLALDGHADLRKALKWNANIYSKDIQLSDTNASSLLTAQIQAYNSDENHIIVEPTLQSSMAELYKTRLTYDINLSRLHVKANVKDINLSLYHSPSLTLSSTIDLKPLHVSTFMRTPFEAIDLNLTYKQGSTQGTFLYDIARLDRFAALNPDFDIKGSGRLSQEGEHLNLALDTQQFDRIDLTKDENKISLKAHKITLKKLFELTQKDALLDANVSLLATISPQHITLSIDTPHLQPREQNATIRPTPLHVRLDLDGNMTRYEGALLLKTNHETLTCKPLSLSPKHAQLQSDFKLFSDDLKRGTLILPDLLEGSSTFYGTLDFNKTLRLHVNNDAIHFSKAFHQKIDVNATDGFDMAMKSDLHYAEDKAAIDAWASTPFFDLETFTTHVDLKRSTLLSQLHINSDIVRSKSDAHIKMHYSNPFEIDANVSTDYESLRVKNVRVDTQNHDVNGSYVLTFLQTPDTDLFKHGNAQFYGEMSTLPQPQATLKSHSFDGSLDLSVTQKQINLDAKSLSLEKMMKFIQSDSALKSGTLDMKADLYSDNFLELNTSLLKGDIALDGTHLLLEGIDADRSINTLRNYQDISLFEGNFPGKSIVTSVLKAPMNLMSDQEIPKSKIERIHADSYIEAGRFYCYDCAVKTAQNRIAIKGAIDLNTTDFQYFEVGLLRKNDCVFFTQDIKGSLKAPEVQLSKTSLKLIAGTVESVGGVLKDGVNLGTSLISKTGQYTAKAINEGTDYIPVVNKATGALSESITELSDAPDSANRWLTHECTPFYRGVVRPSDSNGSSLVSSVESVL